MRPAGLGVLSAFLDNPFTRGWSDLVATRVVTPLERLGLDDEQYRRSLANAASNVVPAGSGPAPLPETALDRIYLAALAKYGDEEAARDYAGALKDADMSQGQLAGLLMRAEPQHSEGLLEGLSRQQLVELESRLIGGNAEAAALTNPGHVAVNVLGNPLAAYGAALGGGALGTLGGMEIARRMGENQPVAEGASDEELAAEEIKKAADARKAKAASEEMVG
jgi:hypothetical protein